MARTPRQIIPGYPYHVTHRGNHGVPIFLNDADRLDYLQNFRETAKRYKLEIWAWCLMSNHVHFVAIPLEKESLAATIRLVHGRHAQRINNKQEITGHFWESRFYSCCLGYTHLFNAVKYVELNPVRAGLVQCAQDYRWSSARGHINKQRLSSDFPDVKRVPLSGDCPKAKPRGLSPDSQGTIPYLSDYFPNNLSQPFSSHSYIDPLLSADDPFPANITDWSAWLAAGIDHNLLQEIRQHTNKGKPLGNKEFIEKIQSTIIACNKK